MDGVYGEERILRERILGGYAVEAALRYAGWLEAQGRFADARLLLAEALREGPDYSRGEVASTGLLLDLEAAWARVHEKLGVSAVSGADLYNAGLRARYKASWPSVLAQIPETSRP